VDVRFFVVNPAALDDLKFLLFSPGSAHVNKDGLFMEKSLQGIYIAL
jgi:hypothetical protein